MLVDHEPAGDGGRADLHAALARHGVPRPVSGRTPFLLDQPDRVDLVVAGRIAPGELFPLVPTTWAAIGAGGDVTCVDTASALVGGRVWGALDAFHAAIADVLPVTLRLGAADEMKGRKANRRRCCDAAAVWSWSPATDASADSADGTPGASVAGPASSTKAFRDDP